jgi:hypothetical protein
VDLERHGAAPDPARRLLRPRRGLLVRGGHRRRRRRRAGGQGRSRRAGAGTPGLAGLGVARRRREGKGKGEGEGGDGGGRRRRGSKPSTRAEHELELGWVGLRVLFRSGTRHRAKKRISVSHEIQFLLAYRGNPCARRFLLCL